METTETITPMNHEVVSRRPLRVIVHGAAGRMGQRVVALSMDDPDIQLIAAVDHADHDAIGHDIGVISGGQSCGVMLTSQFPDQIEQASDESPPIVIDFSLPSAIDDCIEHCRTNGWPLVVATTGLEDGQKQHLRDASRAIPIVWAPSMSPAVNVSMKVVQQITAALRNVAGGLDIEVIERHHRFKADAPSGTALRFGELLAESLTQGKSDQVVQHVHGREGSTGERRRSEIGYHAIRVGDNPGEHTIVFGMLGEKIELNVAASNRDCYASGAIAAAKWLIDSKAGTRRSSGLHNMFDVLGLNND